MKENIGVLSRLVISGDKIDVIKWDYSTGEEECLQYPGRLLSVIDGKSIKMSMTEEQYVAVNLQQGDRQLLCFYTNRGRYLCRSRVTDSYIENLHYFMELELLSEFEKFQERQFYRVDYTEEFLYRLLGEEEQRQENAAFEPQADGWKKAVSTDLSGGGLRFMTEEKYYKPDIFSLRIKMMSETELYLYAKLISSKPMENRQGFYLNRVQFVRIGSAEREEIIRFIFEKERKRRRVERGMVDEGVGGNEMPAE